MKRCQWCKHGHQTVDPADVPYVMCRLTPPMPLTIQSVKTRPSAEGGTGQPELVTDIQWVRPAMTLIGYCGQFKLSVWKLLTSRGPRT